MKDKIDDMFASDLNKLSMPSELALNAAKVVAAQDPKKKGAEKPDLGAPGKSCPDRPAGPATGPRDRTGPHNPLLKRLEKMKKKALFLNIPHRQQVMLEAAEKARAGCPDKPAGPATGPRDRTGPHNPLLKRLEEMKKKSSVDERFAADLHQVVGLDVPEADPDWQRPDVRVAGQATDRIDDHLVDWMRERADEDVVKEASGVGDATKLLQNVARKALIKGDDAVAKGFLRSQQLKGAAKALGATAALGGAVYGGHRLAKKAAVIENPENLKLIDLIRAKSEKLFDKDAAVDRTGKGLLGTLGR